MEETNNCSNCAFSSKEGCMCHNQSATRDDGIDYNYMDTEPNKVCKYWLANRRLRERRNEQ